MLAKLESTRSQSPGHHRHCARHRPVPCGQHPVRRAVHVGTPGSDGGPTVHALRGHRQGALEHRGADRSALLLHQPAGRARAVFQRLRTAGRGAARASTSSCPRARSKVERLDPQPFSPEEDLAVAEGLEGLPLRADGTQAYFGLSGRNSTDDIEVIGYLAPERANFLEYDLTRLVHDLASPEKPVVARARRSAADGQPVQSVPALARPAGDVPVLRRALPGGQAGPDRRGRRGPDARPAAQRRPGDALCDRPVRDARRPRAGVRRSARRGHGGGRRHEPDGQSRGRRDRRARAAARGMGRGDLERPGDRRSHRGATRERAGRGPPGGDRLSALAQPRCRATSMPTT